MMEKIANRPFQIEMPGEQSEQIRLPFLSCIWEPGEN